MLFTRRHVDVFQGVSSTKPASISDISRTGPRIPQPTIVSPRLWPSKYRTRGRELTALLLSNRDPVSSGWRLSLARCNVQAFAEPPSLYLLYHLALRSRAARAALPPQPKNSVFRNIPLRKCTESCLPLRLAAGCGPPPPRRPRPGHRSARLPWRRSAASTAAAKVRLKGTLFATERLKSIQP